MKKLILLSLLGICMTIYGQNTAEKDFIKWAKKNAQELPMDTKETEHSFEAVGKAIGDAQFVAISESAHNTREFIKMNAELVKYLIEEKGFTRLVGETGFPESSLANDYINGADIPKNEWTAGINKMYSRWEEFNELIEWLRNYNNKVSDEKKVQFYGIDITGGYHNLMPVFKIVNAYFEKVDPDYALIFSAKLSPYLEVLKSDEPRQARNRFIEKLLIEQKYDFELVLNKTIRHINKQKKVYKNKSSLKEYDFARQSCISFFYAINYYIESSERGNTDFNKTVGLNGREIAMYENFQYVHQQDTAAKIIIIEHNVHSKSKSGYLDESWKFFTPFGAFVRQEFGDKYYTIGAAYNDGVYWENWTQNEKPIIKNTKPAEKGHLDFVLKQVGIPYFFVDFRSIPKNRPAYKWLSQPVNCREHEEPMPITPNEFDGFIYYERISIPTEYK